MLSTEVPLIPYNSAEIPTRHSNKAKPILTTAPFSPNAIPLTAPLLPLPLLPPADALVALGVAADAPVLAMFVLDVASLVTAPVAFVAEVGGILLLPPEPRPVFAAADNENNGITPAEEIDGKEDALPTTVGSLFTGVIELPWVVVSSSPEDEESSEEESSSEGSSEDEVDGVSVGDEGE